LDRTDRGILENTAFAHFPGIKQRAEDAGYADCENGGCHGQFDQGYPAPVITTAGFLIGRTFCVR